MRHYGMVNEVEAFLVSCLSLHSQGFYKEEKT